MENNDYFRTYRLLIEYKQFLQSPIEGVYILPSINPTHVLHGVLSVREGLYQGLHSFTVTLPPLYPAHEPHLSLACVVPHPLISSDGRVSTTSQCTSLRTCLEHLYNIMHTTDVAALCRTTLAPIINQPAHDLWMQNKIKFREQLALALHSASLHLQQADLTLFHPASAPVSEDTLAQFRRDLLAM